LVNNQRKPSENSNETRNNDAEQTDCRPITA
jgi:hypothetical protein